MASTPEFLNVPVKLGIVRDDGNSPSVYRLVVVPSTVPELFEALRRMAVLSHLQLEGEDKDLDDGAGLDLGRYRIDLSYVDMQGDTVHLGSPPELQEALRWWYSPGSDMPFRVRASVRDKKKSPPSKAGGGVANSSSSSVSASSADSATQTPPPPTAARAFGGEALPAPPAAARAPEPPTPPATLAPPPPPQAVHQIVDAVAGILGPALEAIRRAAAESAPPHPLPTPPAAVSRSGAVHVADTAAEGAADAGGAPPPATRPFVHGRHTCDGCSASPIIGNRYHSVDVPDYDLCEACHRNYQGTNRFEVLGAATTDKAAEGGAPPGPAATSDNPAPPADPFAPPATATRPFVHGRHTCDGCLTTPIVGNRYHSVDVPDYDLCEACHRNYGGGLRFEVVELERDRPFQERWHRRRSRMIATGGGGGGVRAGFHGRRNGPHHHPRFRGGGGRGSPFGGCTRYQHIVGGGPAGFSASAHPTPEEVDGALKEAIRRSLQDVKKAESSKEPTPAAQEEPAAEEAAAPAGSPVLAHDTTPAAPAAEGAPRSRYAVEEDSDDEEENGDNEHPEEINMVAKSPAALDQIKSKTMEAEAAAPPATIYSGRASVESSPSPAKAPSSAEAAASTPLTGSGVNRSFASDAEGSGDVAAALGEMMDLVASCISEMNDELDRKQPSDTHAANNGAEEPEVVVPPAATVVDGTTIVDGEDDPTDGLGSNGSWDEVDDAFGASEEALARAAMVIGSSLLSSDVANSTSGGTAAGTSASAASVSSVGSVPTTVPSIALDRSVAAPQLERWALQLQQLHELGFHDDVLLVDIIERLNAANIGVDSDDEVTVHQVVDELMREW